MFQWITFFASVGVSLPTIAGLSYFFHRIWLVRYQAELEKDVAGAKAEIDSKFEKELEDYRETLRREGHAVDARVGHRIYLSQAQFDTEFGSLKDCFSAAGKLRLAFNGLLPMVGWSEGNEDEKLKGLSRRVSDMGERYNVFVDATETMSPFIPQDISVEFEACAKAAFLCMQHVRSDLVKALSHGGHLDAEKFRAQFGAAYSRAAKLARDRFERLSIST